MPAETANTIDRRIDARCTLLALEAFTPDLTAQEKATLNAAIDILERFGA